MSAVLDIADTTERIEAEICTLAAQIAAATCRFVLLVAELDRRRAWAEWGCRSMAHWLAWKTGMSMVAARQHVRVGRSLEPLPEVTRTFEAGQLSYSKVRALVRVATPATERALIDFAQESTAAQLEFAIRGYERTRVSADAAAAQVAARYLRTIHEDDGTVTIVARLPRDSAELVLAAIEKAVAEVPDDIDPYDSAESRRADALELVARSFLAGNAERVPTEIVVHVDEDEVAAGDESPVIERLTCDTALRSGGGRRSQTIPIALRRAVEYREQHCCRWPGCTNRRFLHVHHIIHRARNGPTDAENCVMLCTFHHRAAHEGGWRVHGNANVPGGVVFLNPQGRRIPEHPQPPPLRAPLALAAGEVAGGTGERVDRAAAIDAVIDITELRSGP
jgi:hypothetical protein